MKIICGKYLPHGGVPKPHGVGQKSRLWWGICKIWNTMVKGIGWALGDGKRVRFWLDNWLDLPRPLVDYVIKEIPEHVLQFLVSDVVDSNGQWA